MPHCRSSELLPYAPFGRSDRLGRSADFTSRNTYQRGQGRRGGDNNEGFSTRLMLQRNLPSSWWTQAGLPPVVVLAAL
jgi:hypothetical protein